MGHLYNTPATQGSGITVKEGVERLESGGGRLQGDAVFQAQGSCMYEFTEVSGLQMTCACSSQTKEEHGERRRGCEVLLLTKELLTINGYSEPRVKFWLRV